MSDAQEHQGVVPTPDPEELKQEEDALQESKREEVRASIMEKYGLDEDLQGDLIEKLTDDNLEQRKSFGKVIRQKRAYRDQVGKTKPSEELKAPQSQPSTPDVDALVNEKFEQRDLESLDIPEELKPEVQKLAKMQGISVRKAAQDSYIVHRKQEIERANKAEDAAITRSKKGTTVRFDANKPPEVDMSTEEGRKTWNEYKKFIQGQS